MIIVFYKGSRFFVILIKVVYFDMYNLELEGNLCKCLESLGVLCRKSYLNDFYYFLLFDWL